jgi:hypothetical protein
MIDKRRKTNDERQKMKDERQKMKGRRLIILKYISIFFYLTSYVLCCLSCGTEEVKTHQTIRFETIPLQNFMDGSYLLTAEASSGLPVTFTHGNNGVIDVRDNNRVVFLQPGSVYITAHQAGNEAFYEAPAVSQELIIKDRDPNKSDQTIQFELEVSVVRVSQINLLKLKATASSGLPVTFKSSNETVGKIANNTLYLQHSYTGEKYEANIQIMASQEGNETYNPADNVTRDLHVILDIIH